MTYYAAPSDAHMSNYWRVTFADKPVSPLGETNIAETVYVQAWSDTDLREKIGRLFRSRVVALIEPDYTEQVRTVDNYSTTQVRCGEHVYRVANEAIAKIQESQDETIADLQAQVRTLGAALAASNEARVQANESIEEHEELHIAETFASQRLTHALETANERIASLRGALVEYGRRLGYSDETLASLDEQYPNVVSAEDNE